MLVLSAAYYNTWVKHFIDGPRFQGLLLRTIGFLRRLAPISPTCRIDCGILENIHALLFPLPSEEQRVYHGELEPPSATNSFSS